MKKLGVVSNNCFRMTLVAALAVAGAAVGAQAQDPDQITAADVAKTRDPV